MADLNSQSPAGSLTQYLNPKGLAANPYVYLVPVGLDMMRSPAFGDTGAIRTWNVQEVAIPLPFNIGGSEFSTKPLWTSADSLTEPMFTLRKHPAFRPVPGADSFSTEWVQASVKDWAAMTATAAPADRQTGIRRAPGCAASARRGRRRPGRSRSRR